MKKKLSKGLSKGSSQRSNIQKGSNQRPAKSSQLSFLNQSFDKPRDVFGGSLLKSHPKVKRPLVTNFPIHLVLRSNYSMLRLPKNYGKVHKAVYETAKKYGIKIYEYANVGNHLHLLIKLTKLKLWRGFIRELTSKLAHLVHKETDLRIRRDHLRSEEQSGALMDSQKQPKKFWKHRPFTRIIRGWKKAFKTMKDYIQLNLWEAEGHISRKDIRTLRDLRALFESG